jgi:hypothetical protein
VTPLFPQKRDPAFFWVDTILCSRSGGFIRVRRSLRVGALLCSRSGGFILVRMSGSARLVPHFFENIFDMGFFSKMYFFKKPDLGLR